MDLLIFINVIGIFTINKVSAPDDCVNHWEFKNPIDWCCDVDYKCCGPNQSPIDIQTREVTRYEECLIFHKYEKVPHSLALHNNKYTVQLLHKGDAYVTYAKVKYRFDRATFHFGQTSALGSMHTINRQQFPMEMHLVHINNKYDSIEEAKKHKDGLLIVAVLFMPTFHDNNDLRNIIYDLHYVMWKGDVLCIKPFPLKQLLPLRYKYHYSYDGSLPFPPCTESVKWVVLHMPVYISEYQLGQFRKLQLTTHKKCPNGKCPMWNNRRRAICYDYRERDNDSEPIMIFYGSTYRPRTVVWGPECDEVSDC